MHQCYKITDTVLTLYTVPAQRLTLYLPNPRPAGTITEKISDAAPRKSKVRIC